MATRTALMTAAISIAFLLPLTLGCSSEAPDPQPEPTGEATELSRELDPDNPTLLARPFTAEQIRDEWIEGFHLIIRQSSPNGEAVERWTVVAADPDGLEIESAALDRGLQVVGEPTVVHSGWVELRNHASFPADRARREWTSRTTALGALEGWLYTVADEEAGTVSELFFAASLPGAPVQVTVRRGDETLADFEQLERFRP